MGLKLITPPAAEPVTLEEVKAHLRVDDTTDDTLIASLITAAREYAETVTRRAIPVQTLELTLDEWPVSELSLPLPPLRSVDSINYRDAEGNVVPVQPNSYIVDINSDPGRVVPISQWPDDELYPVSAITVRFTAGYETIPLSIKQVMLLLIGHWYEQRQAVGANMVGLPFAVDALLWPHRVLRWL